MAGFSVCEEDRAAEPEIKGVCKTRLDLLTGPGAKEEGILFGVCSTNRQPISLSTYAATAPETCGWMPQELLVTSQLDGGKAGQRSEEADGAEQQSVHSS